VHQGEHFVSPQSGIQGGTESRAASRVRPARIAQVPRRAEEPFTVSERLSEIQPAKSTEAVQRQQTAKKRGPQARE